jgi:hypothetical protein
MVEITAISLEPRRETTRASLLSSSAFAANARHVETAGLYWKSLPATVKRLVWMELMPTPPTLGPSTLKMFVPKGLPVMVCVVLGLPR